MAGKIFVNYRRDDARDMAARVRDRLAQRFGDANVFMDVDNLLPGQRFDRELEKALGQTDVFLAAIGPRWLELLAERRANGERDYVREEIAEALRRGITVIPVLVERTPLPSADALPADIGELVLHQKHVVTHEQFGRDVAGLIEAIRFGMKVARAGIGGRSPARWGLAAGLALLVLGGGVVAYQAGARLPWIPEQSGEAPRKEGKAAETKADREAQALLQRVEAEKAQQEEDKRALATAAAQKADQEAQAKQAREEADRQRLATLKREQERERAEEDRKRAEADEEARVKADAERQRLALAQQEEQKRKAEAEALRDKQEREARETERRRLALLKAEEERRIAAEKRQADEKASET